VSTLGVASEAADAPDIRFEKGWDARRARWIGLAGLAVALVGAPWLIWGGGSAPSPSAKPSADSAAPSGAAAASERVSPPPPLPERQLAAANDQSLLAAAANAEGAARRMDEGNAAKDGSNGTPPLRSAAPRRRGKKVEATSAAPTSAAPPFDKATMSRALSSAVQKAEQCDRWGRATGTAQLFVTFAPSGSVSEAHLVGEPIASAAVARCILHHVRASTLPPFAGPPITVSRKITLR